MIKKIFISIFLISIFVFCGSVFATNLVNSNSMTIDIATDIIDYINNTNCFYYTKDGSSSTWNSYYTNFDVNSFVNGWNNSDISNYCENLEQCTFLTWVYSGTARIIVLFDNNTIGNTLDFLTVDKTDNTHVHFYYRDDNGNYVSGYRMTITLKADGTTGFSFNNVPNTGFTSDCLYGGGFDVTNNILTYYPLFTFRYQGHFYNNSNWVRNSISSVIPYVEPEPPVPIDTTGTITDLSGDKTGNIDLTGIVAGIDDINQNISNQTETITNQISGDTQKVINTLTESADSTINNTIITSGDIVSALDFNFPDDPYENFWLALTNGLSSALTGNQRSIDITFRGTTYTISLDNFTLQVPSSLKTILTLFSTTFIFWILIKWWKIILDKITSGDVDELLSMNEEERYY